MGLFNHQLMPQVNFVLAEILAANAVTTETGKTLRLRDHIPPLECQIIQAWIRLTNPQRVLEIGLGYGISTLFICDALQWDDDTAYHIIDAFQSSQWQSVGRLNFERAGYGRVLTLHEKLTSEVLPQMVSDGQLFDFVLVDGAHQAEQVMFDVIHADSLLADDGTLVLDDIQLPAVQAAVAHLTSLGRYAALPIPAPLDHSLPVRVRRLNGIPQSRVVGYRKRNPQE